jgi:hypothetical protein
VSLGTWSSAQESKKNSPSLTVSGRELAKVIEYRLFIKAKQTDLLSGRTIYVIQVDAAARQ